MSKSKGNVVDPLEVMDRFGTDAFRFTLAALAAQGRDVRLSDDRIQGYRNFVNKLWNASRFTLMNLDGYDLADTDKPITDESGLSLADAWILSRIGTIVGQVETHLNEYHFDRAAGDLYQFVWHEFCDWYLELIKPVLYGDDQDARRRTQAVLAHVLSVILRLLHPIMPFVTEEIWQKLPGAGGWIITARFPSPDSGRPDPKAEQGMELLQGVITAVRNIRGEMNVPPSQQVEIIMMAEDAGQRRSIEEQSRYVLTLARGKSLQVKPPEKKPKGAAAAVFGQVEVFINLKGLIDFDEEARRLQKEMDKLDKEIIRSNKKLSNEDFLSKAPAEIVAREKDKVKTIDAKREKLALNLARVEELKGQ